MGRWRHALDVKRLDIGGVLEHRSELSCEAVKLLVREGKPGQAGHVGDVVFGNRLSHSVMLRDREGPPGAERHYRRRTPSPVGGP